MTNKKLCFRYDEKQKTLSYNNNIYIRMAHIYIAVQWINTINES